MDDSPLPSVLVTGASSGIGRAAVLALAQAGYDVYAGVRRSEDGEALTRAARGRVTPLYLDVTCPEMVGDAAAYLDEALGTAGLFGLVNNAGVVVAAPLEFVPLDDVREQFEVNVTGALAVTQSVLPLLRRAGGRIVNIGSVSGSFSTPFTGPYNASKFALRAMSDALRLELAPWDIGVSIIEPGTVHTPLWQRSLRRIQGLERRLPPKATALYGPVFAKIRQFIEGARGVPAENVAAVIKAVLRSKRPRAYYSVGVDARLRLALERLPTRLRDFLIASQLPKYPAPDR
ncbi:MAG: SDR family oxidoreductase [Deinococcales bacterium]